MLNLELLEEVKFIEPGPETLAVLDKVPNHMRYKDLSSFKRIGYLCGWCNKNEVRKSNAKYCSSDCRESAEIYCYPQHPQAKAWIFINKQNCTCFKCGEIFEDEIRNIILKKKEHMDSMFQKYGKDYGWKKESRVSYWQVGKAIGSRFQLDHVSALCNGGRGIGLDNHQVVCNKCHHTKTAEDLSAYRLSRA